jgi:REP element-mobilizing transposase RayT
MSDVYQSQAHSKWDCKYHVVLVPKRRRKAIFGNIRRQLGPIFHALAKQKECQIVEGHLMPVMCTCALRSRPSTRLLSATTWKMDWRS